MLKSGSLAFALLFGVALATPAAAQQRLRPGLYVGEYLCAQGETALRLAVWNTGGARQLAVFEFGGNAEVPIGSYTVQISRERGGLYRLTPLRWVRQPVDYEMVGAELRRRGGQLSGRIADPRCGAIRLSGPVPMRR